MGGVRSDFGFLRYTSVTYLPSCDASIFITGHSMAVRTHSTFAVLEIVYAAMIAALVCGDRVQLETLDLFSSRMPLHCRAQFFISH
jgi:hypothetical protein